MACLLCIALLGNFVFYTSAAEVWKYCARSYQFDGVVLPDVPAPSDQALEITTVVEGLNPYTQYKFRVVGVNALGEGQPSKPSSKFCIEYCFLPICTFTSDLKTGLNDFFIFWPNLYI